MVEFKFNYAELPYASEGQPSDQNRFNWRCETLLTRNSDLIQGKTVLDLACNTGRLSYPCLVLGAKKVVGVEARQELIDTGKGYLSGSPLAQRMEFVKSDVFAFLESSTPGAFDTILCFGFLYHTTRQVDFFREVKRLRPAHAIIDTNVAKNYFYFSRKKSFWRPPCLRMIVENPEKTSDTIDEDGVAFWPSTSFLEEMFRVIGYDFRRLDYSAREIKDWQGMDDYRRGFRASYIGIRRNP